MKKILTISALALLLCASMTFPALAKTTGIQLDGKTYTVFGDITRFEADGKTFTIENGEVVVSEPGKPERRFPLGTDSDDSSLVQDAGTASTSSEISYVLVSGDGESVEDFDIQLDPAAAQRLEGSVTYVYTNADDADAMRAEDYAEYAEYGLRCEPEQNALYYQGSRVRIFQDLQTIDSYSVSTMEHIDKEGVIDVNAERDADGKIIGLRVLSDAEFAAQNPDDYLRACPPLESPFAQEASNEANSIPMDAFLPSEKAAEGSDASASAYTASEGVELTPEEKADFFAPYADLGITYDAEADVLRYQGRTVRHFLDVRQSNGEALDSGRFQGSITTIYMDDGEIDVEIIRDHSRKDADGNGAIAGISYEEAH